MACIMLFENKILWRGSFLPLQDDKEKKRLELLERKKENQRLLDEENAKLKGRSQKETAPSGKVTRAQIEETLQNEQLQQEQQDLKPQSEFKFKILTTQWLE